MLENDCHVIALHFIIFAGCVFAARSVRRRIHAILREYCRLKVAHLFVATSSVKLKPLVEIGYLFEIFQSDK